MRNSSQLEIQLKDLLHNVSNEVTFFSSKKNEDREREKERILSILRQAILRYAKYFYDSTCFKWVVNAKKNEEFLLDNIIHIQWIENITNKCDKKHKNLILRLFFFLLILFRQDSLNAFWFLYLLSNKKKRRKEI